MSKKTKTKEMPNPRIILGFVLGIFVFLLTGLSLYFAFRRTLARFSMDFFYPALKAAHEAENFTVKQTLLTRSKHDLAKTVTMLQKENAVLSAKSALMLKYYDENRRLRKMLSLQVPASYRAVFAEIILRDPATWNELFTIDCGSNDGIREGDPVVSVFFPEKKSSAVTAVVGRVKKVSHHSAIVATLFNPDCSLSISIIESHASGRLTGNGTGSTLTHLPVDRKYGVGEIVTTSGYSAQTPRGLFVGRLRASKTGAAAHVTEQRLYAEAEMVPMISFENLRFVAVLVRSEKK